MRTNILNSKRTTTWIVILMTQGTIWNYLLWYQIVTPNLIVSRIIKSALKLILDTLIFTIRHCHQDKSSTTTTTKVLWYIIPHSDSSYKSTFTTITTTSIIIHRHQLLQHQDEVLASIINPEPFLYLYHVKPENLNK